MAEVLTEELSFGRYRYGYGTEGAQVRKLIWLYDPNLLLSLNFASAIYSVSGVPYPVLSTAPGYSFSRTGAVGFPNQLGTVEYFAADVPPIFPGLGFKSYYATTNLLLNAGTSSGLSTQSVAVTAVEHTLSFFGTGTVTLSGASTAGPLVGTGANDRVSLVFTPAAGSLTLTVSGSVTFAGLYANNFSDGGPIIATTGVTASIGASLLNLSPVITTDEDHLITLVVTFAAPPTPFAERIHNQRSADGSDRIIIERQVPTGELQFRSRLAGVFQPIIASGINQVTAGQVTVLLRRRSGSWTIAVKNSSGVTGQSVETAEAYPAGLAGFYLMGDLAGNPASGTMKLCTLERGTFSDTDLTARLAITY